MTIPKLYDIHETSSLVRMSVSWLYRNAGVTIPVTRVAGSRRLYWTEEQIAEIIRDSAQPAKAVKRTSQKREAPAPARAVKKTPPVKTSGVNIPQARPERSRRYRPASAA